ncbi:MAG: phytoene desaturase family protein [Actinomycetota bacterium]
MGAETDAIVVGSGPNGMAAAITLARAGRSVTVYEAAPTIGGGCRSAELTLPGFIHDVCSAVHPLAAASPFFLNTPLKEHGLELIQPDIPLAHPQDDGSANALYRGVEETAGGLEQDEAAYRRLMNPLVASSSELIEDIMAPLGLPGHPFKMAAFGLKAARSASALGRSVFEGARARALFAGLAAHSMLPLDLSPSGGFGLMLGLLGHSAGWPVAKSGSQKIADSMGACLKSLGGEIVTGQAVQDIEELPRARAYLFDVGPRQLARIAGARFPAQYLRRLARYRYGPGVFKVDWALNEPVPWMAEKCRGAGTLHLGGAMEEIEIAEKQVSRGVVPPKPFVLFSQPSIFDDSRSPKGKHTAWGYCHVPHGSGVDMTERIEDQVERFAPGFRDCILAKATMNSGQMEKYNGNYIGGDINGGVQDLRQLFTRPVARFPVYSTPDSSIYICSSSSPPGGGVHGMCGYHAARSALRRSLR